MVLPHRMRLRPPWERTRQRDQILWRRRFGKPSNLDLSERVFLAIESPAVEAQVSLNGQPLGCTGPTELIWRVPVTHLLQRRNELVLHVASTQFAASEESTAVPFREVRLEIE